MTLLSDLFGETSLFRVVAFFGFVYAIGVAVYRLYFHPLAKYPGPFWARLTGWPSYYHTLHGDRHIWLWRLQEEYGPTVRYGPDRIVMNTPTAFKTIYGPKGNVKKGEYYQVWPRNVEAVNTWSTTSVAKHSRKRRVLNNAFSDKALRSAEGFVIQHTDRWCELINERDDGSGWTDSLDMADWSNYLVFDILGDLCFGKSFDMKEPGNDYRFVPELLVSFLSLVHPIAFSPFSSLWVWLKPRGLDWIFENTKPEPLKKWTRFVDECLARRTKAEDELQNNPDSEAASRKDFFHYLFKAVDPETGEQGYDLNELYGECELLIIAGSDTTSIVFAAMFFYLARNPEVQAKLAKEVLSAFSTFDDIKSGNQLHSCKYLRAFLYEAMRMTPPVSAEPFREVLPGGMAVDGEFFQEGLNVSTCLYALSYNKDIYPEPFKFRPERWIVDENETSGSSPDSVALAEFGFCSFSTGSRGCVGKNLALLEMSIVMAKVIYQFEIRPDAKNNLGAGDPNGKPGRQCAEQFQIFDAFVAVRHGPMVQFKKRC